MSKLQGGAWPAQLELSDLHLPRRSTARRATIEDLDAFVAISTETLGPYARELYGLSDEHIRDGLGEDFTPGATVTIERGRQPIVFVVVEARQEEWWLDHMVVAPSEQGAGLGTALVRWLQRAARPTSTPITLSVVDRNPARELYARLDFAIERIEPPRTFMCWDDWS